MSDAIVALCVDINGVAALLGVSRRTAYRLDDGGKLPAPVVLGNIKRWRVRELEAWLKAGAPKRDAWEWSEAS